MIPNHLAIVLLFAIFLAGVCQGAFHSSHPARPSGVRSHPLPRPFLRTAHDNPVRRDAAPSTYAQEFSTRYTFASAKSPALTFPTACDGPAQQIVQWDSDTVWLLSDTGLWNWDEVAETCTAVTISNSSESLAVIAPGSRMLVIDASDAVVVSPSAISLLTCNEVKCDVTSQLEGPTPWGAVSSITVALNPSVIVFGTATGLFQTNALTDANLNVTEITRVQPSDASSPCQVTALAYHAGIDQLAVGTNGEDLSCGRLWRLTNSTRWDWFWTDSDLDDNITALAYSLPSGDLWVGTEDALNVLRGPAYAIQNDIGSFERLGHLEGLPYASITAILPLSDDEIYIGTAFGLILYEPQAALRWRYYAGFRFLNGDQVTALSQSPASQFHSVKSGQHVGFIRDDQPILSTVYVATNLGFSVFQRMNYTLAQKAHAIRGLRDPRHNRFGLVSDCGLSQFGNVSSWFPSPSDNDGLWTSVFLSSLCFEYAATGNASAKADANYHLAAMELLNNVTGIVGLPARSVVPSGVPPGSGHWHNSTAPGYTSWTWKGDTSSDEITGHMQGFSVYHDYCAETAEEKAHSARLMLNILDYIIANNFTLVDVTGKRTTWGFWDPHEVNDVQEHYSERGMNSLEMLSWLFSAYRITNNQTYLDLAVSLGEQFGYYLNMENVRVRVPDDVDASDDHLIYWSYVMFAQTIADVGSFLPADAIASFQRSILRSWKALKPTQTSFYTYIQYFALPDSVTQEDLDGAERNLQQFTTELISWPYRNSQRIDIVKDFEFDPSRTDAQGTKPLPAFERDNGQWTDNPYNLDGSSGYSEQAPSPFLVAYWLGRMMGLVQ